MLEEIKNYLKITWNDEDEHIREIIGQCKGRLNELVGAELDFETKGLARSLLFDFCRYVYNNASEYFEENFAREILRLQFMVGVKELPEDGGFEEVVE